MAEFDARVLVPITSAMRDAIDAEAGPRGRSDFIRSAIEARLNGVVPKVAGLSGQVKVGEDRVPDWVKTEIESRLGGGAGRDVTRSKGLLAGAGRPASGPDPRFATVASAIRKRGRSTVRQIVLDTGMTDMAVESVLRKMQVRWPEPGVVELSE